MVKRVQVWEEAHKVLWLVRNWNFVGVFYEQPLMGKKIADFIMKL